MPKHKISSKITFDACSEAVDRLLQLLGNPDLPSGGIELICKQFNLEFNQFTFETIKMGFFSKNVSNNV